MNRQSMTGGLRSSALLLIWSSGLVLAVGQFYAADAALMTPSPMTVARLAEAPRLDDTEALGKALERALRGSEVLNGDWQPAPPEQQPPAPELQPPPDVAEGLPLAALGAGTEGPAAAESPVEVASGQHPVAAAGPQLDPDGEVDSGAAPDSAELGAAGPEDASASPAPALLDTAEPATAGLRKTPSRNSYALADVKQTARHSVATGSYEAAYRLLLAAVENGREDVEFLGLLALAALQAGHSDEAVVVYRRLVELQPTSERWWAGLAMAQERLGYDALPTYQHLLGLSQGDSALKRLVRQKVGAFG